MTCANFGMIFEALLIQQRALDLKPNLFSNNSQLVLFWRQVSTKQNLQFIIYSFKLIDTNVLLKHSVLWGDEESWNCASMSTAQLVRLLLNTPILSAMQAGCAFKQAWARAAVGMGSTGQHRAAGQLVGGSSAAAYSTQLCPLICGQQLTLLKLSERWSWLRAEHWIPDKVDSSQSQTLLSKWPVWVFVLHRSTQLKLAPKYLNL